MSGSDFDLGSKFATSIIATKEQTLFHPGTPGLHVMLEGRAVTENFQSITTIHGRHFGRNF